MLHPDELHDGMAGTQAGFRYRMAYVDPALIQRVLSGEPLPYVAGGVSNDPRLYRAAQPFVQAGELYVVPRGVEHRTAAEGEAKLLMIEPRGVLNTGHEDGKRKAENDVWI